MFSMIKFCLSFCLSFLLLSVPLNKKPLFFYLDSWAKPFTDRVFEHSKIVFWESIEDGKQFSKKVFNNSLPVSDKKHVDKVQVQSSARVKEEIPKQSNDDYTEEERSMLSRILQNEEASY